MTNGKKKFMDSLWGKIVIVAVAVIVVLFTAIMLNAYGVTTTKALAVPPTPSATPFGQQGGMIGKWNFNPHLELSNSDFVSSLYYHILQRPSGSQSGDANVISWASSALDAGSVDRYTLYNDFVTCPGYPGNTAHDPFYQLIPTWAIYLAIAIMIGGGIWVAYDYFGARKKKNGESELRL